MKWTESDDKLKRGNKPSFDLVKYNLQGQLEAVTAELRSLQEEVDSEDDPSIDDEAEDRVGHTTPLERTPHMERGTDPIVGTRRIEDRGTERSTDRGTERSTDRGTTDRRTTEPPGGEERLLPPAGRESPSESLLVATITRLLEAHTGKLQLGRPVPVKGNKWKKMDSSVGLNNLK